MKNVVFIPNEYFSTEGVVMGHPETIARVKAEVDRLTQLCEEQGRELERLREYLAMRTYDNENKGFNVWWASARWELNGFTPERHFAKRIYEKAMLDHESALSQAREESERLTVVKHNEPSSRLSLNLTLDGDGDFWIRLLSPGAPRLDVMIRGNESLRQLHKNVRGITFVNSDRAEAAEQREKWLREFIAKVSDAAGQPSHCLTCEQVWQIINEHNKAALAAASEVGGMLCDAPVKTCDYCKAVGVMPTFMGGETACSVCLRSFPKTPEALRQEVHGLRHKAKAWELMAKGYSKVIESQEAELTTLKATLAAALERVGELEGERHAHMEDSAHNLDLRLKAEAERDQLKRERDEAQALLAAAEEGIDRNCTEIAELKVALSGAEVKVIDVATQAINAAYRRGFEDCREAVRKAAHTADMAHREYDESWFILMESLSALTVPERDGGTE